MDFPSGRDRASVGLMMCADGAYRPLTGILAPPQFSRSASVAVPPTSVCRAPVTTCAPFKCKPIRSNSDSGHPCQLRRSARPRSSATERPVRWRAFGWTKCTAWTRTGAMRWFNNEKDRLADSSVSRAQQVCCSLFRNSTFEPRCQRTATRLEGTGAELRLLIPTNFEPGRPLEHTPGGPFT